MSLVFEDLASRMLGMWHNINIRGACQQNIILRVISGDRTEMYKFSSHPQLKHYSSSACKSKSASLSTTIKPSTITTTRTLLFSLQKMMFPQALMALGALLAFTPATQGFNTSCVYDGYKCGYTMYNVNGMSTLFFSQSTRPISIRHLLTSFL
jgi:hypothetical protein